MRHVSSGSCAILLQIFTSEEVELPRNLVADFLEKLDPAICARYVEFLIGEREENSTMFHNRLAELYLNMTINAKKHGDNGKHSDIKWCLIPDAEGLYVSQSNER